MAVEQIPRRAEKRRDWRRVLGPGLIAGASDDDPSGIATYSQAGAQLGFAISWTMLVIYPLVVAIQDNPPHLLTGISVDILTICVAGQIYDTLILSLIHI